MVSRCLFSFVIRFLISPQPSLFFSTRYPLFSFSLSPLKLQASSEAEETLKRIQSHRGVTGILIVNKDGVPIKSTLSAEDTVQYAALITQVCLLYFTDLTMSPNFLSLTSFQYSLTWVFYFICIIVFLVFCFSSLRKQGASFEHWIHKMTLLFCESDQKNMRSW